MPTNLLMEPSLVDCWSVIHATGANAAIRIISGLELITTISPTCAQKAVKYRAQRKANQMQSLTFHPQSEEEWLKLREGDVTSTSVAALFGQHPRITAFELWHILHSNLTPTFEETERTRWGKRLERYIADGAAEDQGWQIERMTQYSRIPELRLGASFDFRIFGQPMELLECKNVDGLIFKNQWFQSDFGLEAPTSIELQLQCQMGIAGLKRGYIAALVGGNRIEILPRDFDDVIWQRILDVVAAFWARTEAPEPDFAVDAKTISRLYGYSEAGKVIEADAEVTQLLAEYEAAATARRVAEDEQDAAKARLLMKIGDAEKVTSEVGTLSCGVVKAAHVSYERGEYRAFRFHPKRSKL